VFVHNICIVVDSWTFKCHFAGNRRIPFVTNKPLSSTQVFCSDNCCQGRCRVFFGEGRPERNRKYILLPPRIDRNGLPSLSLKPPLTAVSLLVSFSFVHSSIKCMTIMSKMPTIQVITVLCMKHVFSQETAVIIIAYCMLCYVMNRALFQYVAKHSLVSELYAAVW